MRKAAIIALVLAASTAACTDRNEAHRALEQAGYTDIRIGGYSFGCGRDDDTATEFTAIGPAGHRTTGVVCGSYFLKGSTIRTF